MFINLFITLLLWLTLLIDLKKLEKWVAKKREEITEGEFDRWRRRRWPRGIRAGKRIWIFVVALLSIAGFFHGIATMATPVHIYIIWAIVLRGGTYWAVHELTDEKAFLQKFPKLSLKKKVGVAITVCGVLFLSFLYPAFCLRTVGFARASAMRGTMDKFEIGTVEMFPEIDPESLRVTTSGIARSIAELKRTSAASLVTSVHLGMYNGTLAWICTVSETPLFGRLLLGGSNRVREIIVVPVNDATGEKSILIPVKMTFGEGLWFQNGIKIHGTDRFPFRTFTRGYVTGHGEDIVLVTTSYFDGILALYDPKVHVWSLITGDLVGQYTPNDAPDWVVQRWDENYVENMGDKFGDFRWTSENELNYWNGVPYFSDRSADPSEPEGLRYQIWDDELTAVYLFDNKRNKEILELVMTATREGLTLYSVDHLKLLSPDDAKEAAIAGLPALPEKRQYRTPLALIYRIGSEIYYHIPIYTLAERHYYPAYFALVRTTDRSVFREDVGKHGGMTGAIKAVYELVGVEPTEERTITGTLDTKYEYIEGGNTRYWLTIRTEEDALIDVLIKVESLTQEEVLKILKTDIGDGISVVVDQNNVVTEVL